MECWSTHKSCKETRMNFNLNSRRRNTRKKKKKRVSQYKKIKENKNKIYLSPSTNISPLVGSNL